MSQYDEVISNSRALLKKVLSSAVLRGTLSSVGSMVRVSIIIDSAGRIVSVGSSATAIEGCFLCSLTVDPSDLTIMDILQQDKLPIGIYDLLSKTIKAWNENPKA